MQVKVLGSGCANCKTLEARTREAIEKLGSGAEVEKVTDFAEIASHGVMSTPALVIGNTVVVAGRVPGVDELVDMIRRAGT